MKKKQEVFVLIKYEVEIDEDDSVVKDYDSPKELIDDLVSYRFSEMMPVIKSKGVIVRDVEVLKHSERESDFM